MDNYTLEFPRNLHRGRFWPTFHVSHLKQFQNRKTAFQLGVINLNDQLKQKQICVLRLSRFTKQISSF
jgi:polynucleotide 5'-kinase involved in rRNA processing